MPTPANPTSGALRWARASFVAAATVVVAVLAHHLAGGMAAPTWVLAGVVVGAAVLAHRLSAHRWSTRELVAVFVAAQGALHLACTLGGPMPMDGAPSAPLMLATHACATALSVAAVRHGEAVLWSLVEVLAMRPVLALSSPAGVPVVGPRTAAATTRDRRLVSQVLPHVAPVRGPPA
ncbi:hypothetical protein [Solicola sp. PLA-1-18]|uniref:hypothetical protein n=1 Tax=Solicola sp. PLA-1-18 TaxID=3380532 RepID=UPI003B77371B